MSELCAGRPAADERWTRTEDGGYVPIRVPAASDPQTVDVFQLAVRYADTQEPVALSSTYLDGYLFATVPASEAGRPLEVFQGTQPVWTDLEQPYLAVQGASELNIRGVIFGDKAGRLKQDAPLTETALRDYCTIIQEEYEKANLHTPEALLALRDRLQDKKRYGG